MSSVPPGILLSLAIGVEVVGTLALRASYGLTKLGPTALMTVCYATAFALLALVTKQLEIGFVYAVWSGAGTALIAIIGMAAFGESATALKMLSILLIIVGVIGLNLQGH